MRRINKKYNRGNQIHQYIIYDPAIDRFLVVCPTLKGKYLQTKVGTFRNIEDALICRDKYLDDVLFANDEK